MTALQALAAGVVTSFLGLLQNIGDVGAMPVG
jgi:hypothetical protein